LQFASTLLNQCTTFFEGLGSRIPSNGTIVINAWESDVSRHQTCIRDSWVAAFLHHADPDIPGDLRHHCLNKSLQLTSPAKDYDNLQEISESMKVSKEDRLEASRLQELFLPHYGQDKICLFSGKFTSLEMKIFTQLKSLLLLCGYLIIL
jgi:hypothetical protein